MLVGGTRLLALFLLILISDSCGQVVKFRSCIRAPVKDSFNVSQYLGTWYEVQRYFPIFFERNLMCGTATYTQNADGSINVYNRSINRFTKIIDDIQGKAEVVSNAKLNVNFGGADISFGSTPEGNYWVLDTDYNNYAIVYSCTEFFATVALEIVWILGRTPTLPPLTIDTIHTLLRGLDIDVAPLVSNTDIQGSSEVDCNNYYLKRN